MRYRFSVGEPWNFSGPQGDNSISGAVLRKFDAENLLFECDEEVSLKGTSGRYWLLTTRYVGQSFDDEPYTGSVNGALLADPPLESENIREIMERTVFAAIGVLAPS